MTTPRKGRDIEHLEQANFFACISWINHPATRLTFAVPNQAVAKFRSKAARVRFWKEGVRAGVPDILCMYPSRGFHGLAIEMKRPGEKPRPEQLWYLTELKKSGYQVHVCFSGREALQKWACYLNIEVTV